MWPDLWIQMKYAKWLREYFRTAAGGRIVLPVIMLAGIIIAMFTAGAACSRVPVTADRDPLSMEILTSAMSYIKQHHSDAVAYIKADVIFTQLPADKRKPGYSGVTYTGGGWNISIGHAITPEDIYDITADYGGGKIIWIGRSQNNTIAEDSYKKLE